jgi:hypothetical protein
MPCLHGFLPILWKLSVYAFLFPGRTETPWYLHSLVRHARLVLRVLVLRVLLVTGEGNAGEQCSHDDEEDQELHFGW